MDASAIIQALRDRASRFTSLDTPQDSDLADTAIDIGAGFLPVVGTAQSARDFERARREGDKLGMGLAGVGMIPFVGGATKLVGKARKAEKVADALRSVPTESGAARIIEGVQDVASNEFPEALAGFGKKTEREAARQKQIQKDLRATLETATEEAEATKKVGGQRASGAIPADYYRKMEAEQGPEAVLRAAKKGEHIHRRADGSIIGAPRHVTSGAGLGAMRKSLDQQFNEGVDALEYADPERVANWYERTKAGQESVYTPLEYGQGKATEAVLRGFADLPEGVSQRVTGNLSENEGIRNIIKQKMDRDAKYSSARQDVAEMRKFFSEADWARAVEMMRKGVAPAAAVAALGYSLPSMAEERQ